MNNSKFIFVRHGQSHANASGLIADANSPLTEKGIEQARKTGYEIIDKNIKLIICSPYLRAQQTAETIAGEIGIDLAHIMIIDELRERGLGELENNPKQHDGLWYFLDEETTGIETRKELLTRMTDCMSKIRDLSSKGIVLVVGHAISGFYLQQAAKGVNDIHKMESPELMSNADFVEVNYK